MAEAPNYGVFNSGTMDTGGGHVVGHDLTVTGSTTVSPTQITNALQPLAEALTAAPAETRPDAEAKLAELRQEVAKGEKADDRTIAKLVKGLVSLVPSAVSSIVSAFATPVLGGIAGPVTKYVLDELGENQT